MYHYNPLEHALQDLALALHNYRHTPINPLYSHLPTAITVELAGTAISMTVAPRYEQVIEPWARWDTIKDDDASSIISSDTDDFADLGDVDIQPWQTLLLVERWLRRLSARQARQLLLRARPSPVVIGQTRPLVTSRGGTAKRKKTRRC